MYAVEQRFNSLPRLEAGRRVAEVLDQDPALRPLPGSKVGIAVGSRGIDQLSEIVLAVVCWAKRHGCTPVIIPAMGSHGGASPRGQVEVLHNYGIEARSMGAEIRSSLDVEQLGTVEGRAVVWSREALAVDHLVVSESGQASHRFPGEA